MLLDGRPSTPSGPCKRYPLLGRGWERKSALKISSLCEIRQFESYPSCTCFGRVGSGGDRLYPLWTGVGPRVRVGARVGLHLDFLVEFRAGIFSLVPLDTETGDREAPQSIDLVSSTPSPRDGGAGVAQNWASYGSPSPEKKKWRRCSLGSPPMSRGGFRLLDGVPRSPGKGRARYPGR